MVVRFNKEKITSRTIFKLSSRSYLVTLISSYYFHKSSISFDYSPAYSLIHLLFKTMLIEAVVALSLLVYSGCFFSVDLHNILRVHNLSSGLKAYVKVEGPSGFIVSLADVGTIIYFLEALSYRFPVFTVIISMCDFLFRFQFH